MMLKFAFVYLLCFAVTIYPAFACSCIDVINYKAALRAASVTVAFAGKVIGVTTSPQNSYIRFVTFAVLRNWKGATTHTVSVLQGESGNTCDMFFIEPGTEGFDSTKILLFAGRVKQGNIVTNICYPLIVTDDRGLKNMVAEFDSLSMLPQLPEIIKDDPYFRVSVFPSATSATYNGFTIDLKFENADLGFKDQWVSYLEGYYRLTQVAEIEPWSQSTIAGIAAAKRSNGIIRFSVPPFLSSAFGQLPIEIFSRVYGHLPDSPVWAIATSTSIRIERAIKDSLEFDIFAETSLSPLHDYLRVEFNNLKQGIKIILYDKLGQIVFSKNCEEKEKLFSVDVSQIPPGFYTIEIQQNGGKITKKMMKL